MQIMGEKKNCIKVLEGGNWTASNCDEGAATQFNIFLADPFRPYRIMACALWCKYFLCHLPGDTKKNFTS